MDCILALDLGTSAFKSAPVTAADISVHHDSSNFECDYAHRITCPPQNYISAMMNALSQAVEAARIYKFTVRGIGICSQAQTFLALDKHNEPIGPAVVWTDDIAQAEAEEAARALPDFARTSGFLRPSPLQFLPKVMQSRQQNPSAQRFLLLNEWLISVLTGEAYGDETNQGMGGFWDIERHTWSAPALELADISPDNLAKIAPAASYSALLKPEIARTLGISQVPVYSCGNDQSAAAVSAGLEQAGDIFCNFGTAMVVYAFRKEMTLPQNDAQIAGISPLRSTLKGDYFLLGSYSECGDILDRMAMFLYPRRKFTKLIEALTGDFAPELLPQITRIHGGKIDLTDWRIGDEPAHLVRAFWEFYRARFLELLEGVREPEVPNCRLFASGGLSQSQEWLDFLSARVGLPLIRTEFSGHIHPSLVGIARIIAQYSQN